jgi:hypothetical protein
VHVARSHHGSEKTADNDAEKTANHEPEKTGEIAKNAEKAFLWDLGALRGFFRTCWAMALIVAEGIGVRGSRCMGPIVAGRPGAPRPTR